MRNHRSHLRADDGQVWTYLCLPYRLPVAPTQPGPNLHMLTVDGVSTRSEAGQALITARVEAFCASMREEVVKGRVARGCDPWTGLPVD